MYHGIFWNWYFLTNFWNKTLHWIFVGIFGHPCYFVKMSRITTGTQAMNDTSSCVIAQELLNEKWEAETETGYLPAVCQHKRLRDSQSFPLTWPWTYSANVVAMSWGCSHGPRCSNRRPGWYQGQSGWYFLCGAVIQVLSLFTFQIRHVGLGHNRLSWPSPVAWTQINLSPSMYLWCMASFLIADNSKHRIVAQQAKKAFI